MSNREKILVGLMSLAIAYAVYALVLSPTQQPGPKNGDQEQKALKAFIVKVAEKTKNGLSKRQSYILQKAQTDWKRDPLVQIGPENSEKENSSLKALKSRISYSGFLQMGNKRLAIINGMEYETGDILESGGFIIRNIFPDHVIISARGGKRKTITLPMEETD